jgi:hypothetical protein
MPETIHETWLRSLTSCHADDIDAALAWAEDADNSADADAERIAGLEAEVARLRDALMPFAQHAHADGGAYPERRYRICVTEGQLTRAWKALHDGD